VPDPDTLVVVISQSGETADTLAALKHAKSLGMTKTLAICNVPESAIVRESALRFITRAGPEIGVASTKAFTTQLAALALLTLALAKINGRLSASRKPATSPAAPPAGGRRQGARARTRDRSWAQRFAGKHHALFLGRGSHWPIAMEGALKLKEISYIHAEATPPASSSTARWPWWTRTCPSSPWPRPTSCSKSSRATCRKSAPAAASSTCLPTPAPRSRNPKAYILHMPEHYGMLSPILHVIPLQLLSYHAALVKGTDVDKPRNLAKSVTVE
jgi:glucosamine--fructose-6-phosphate aminotransferase (isomerizing)